MIDEATVIIDHMPPCPDPPVPDRRSRGTGKVRQWFFKNIAPVIIGRVPILRVGIFKADNILIVKIRTQQLK